MPNSLFNTYLNSIGERWPSLFLCIFYSSVSQSVVWGNTLRMRESMWFRSCGFVYNCIQSTLLCCCYFTNFRYKIEAKYKEFPNDLMNTLLVITRLIYISSKFFFIHTFYNDAPFIIFIFLSNSYCTDYHFLCVLNLILANLFCKNKELYWEWKNNNSLHTLAGQNRC